MWKIRCSRWINHRIFFGRKNQMLSSRVYEEDRHMARFAIDTLFFIIRRERDHCAKKARLERRLAKAQGKTQPTTPLENGLARIPEKRGAI